MRPFWWVHKPKAYAMVRAIMLLGRLIISIIAKYAKRSASTSKEHISLLRILR